MDAMACAPPLPAAPALAAAIRPELADGPAGAAALEGRRAAVMILLFDVDGEPHIFLTKRTDEMEHHPGQIALPGGRFDDEDGDLRVTALRETHEELGVAPESVEVLGRLDDVFTAASSFVVTPFVAVAAERPVAVPCEREIARVLEVPLAGLLQADRELPDQPDILTLRYPLLGEDVWGATARILRAFSAVVRRAVGTPG